MDVSSSDHSYSDKARLLLYHKQATSARTLFLRLAHGGVSLFDPLPALAQLIDPGDAFDKESKVQTHPAPLLAEAECHFGLPSGSLEIDSEFKASVDIPGGPVDVYLARFTAMDPPHEEVGRQGAKFIALTEARGLADVELELLRRAYAAIMEG